MPQKQRSNLVEPLLLDIQELQKKRDSETAHCGNLPSSRKRLLHLLKPPVTWCCTREWAGALHLAFEWRCGSLEITVMIRIRQNFLLFRKLNFCLTLYRQVAYLKPDDWFHSGEYQPFSERLTILSRFLKYPSVHLHYDIYPYFML